MLLVKLNGVDITDKVDYNTLKITEQMNNRSNTCAFTVSNYMVPEGALVEVWEGSTLASDAISGTPTITVDETYEYFQKYRNGDELRIPAGSDGAIKRIIQSINHTAKTITFTANLGTAYSKGAYVGRLLFAGVTLKNPDQEIGCSGVFVFNVLASDFTKLFDAKNVVDTFENQYPREIIGRVVHKFTAPSSFLEITDAETTTGWIPSGVATPPILSTTDRAYKNSSVTGGASGAGTVKYQIQKNSLYFDGDFSEGGYDGGFTWKRGTNATAGQMDTTMLPTGGFNGGPCMRISPTIAGKFVEMKTFRTSYWGTPGIAIKPNTKYNLKGKIKVVGTGTIGGGAKIACLMNDSGAGATSLQSGTSNSVSTDTGGQWVDLSVTFTSNSLATVGMIMVEVYNHTGSPTFVGDVYFSALTLAEVVDIAVVPRRNLLTYTSDLSNGVWAKQNGTVSSQVFVGPNGKPVYKYTPNTTSIAFHEVFQNTSMVNEYHYVFSAYVQAAGYRYVQLTGTGSGHGTGYVNFDLLTGTETAYGAGTSQYLSRGIDDMGGGWYRIWGRVRWQFSGSLHFGLGVVDSPTATRGQVWAGNGTDGIYIEGMQLELASSPSDFQEIVGTTYTSESYKHIRGWLKIGAGQLSKLSAPKFRAYSSPGNYYEWTDMVQCENCWSYDSFEIADGVKVGTPDTSSIVYFEYEWTASTLIPGGGIKFDQISLTTGSFTIKNVFRGDTIYSDIRAQYKKPTVLLEELAKRQQLYWYVDYERDIHFFEQETYTCPMEITDTSEVYGDLSITADISQLKNRQVVRGGEAIDPSTYTQDEVTDGKMESWRLDYKPKGLKIYVDTTGTGSSYVEKSVGVENLDSAASFDYLYNFNEKIVKRASAPLLANGTLIRRVYYPYKPIRVQVEDSPSITAMKALLGGDGIYDGALITDLSIRSFPDARSRALAEIEPYKNPVITATWQSDQDGWRGGQIVLIQDTNRGIDSSFVIQKVTRTQKTSGKWSYQVQAGSTMFGLIEFFQLLLRRSETMLIDVSEIIDVVKNVDEVIEITEVYRVLKRSAPWYAHTYAQNFSINTIGTEGGTANDAYADYCEAG